MVTKEELLKQKQDIENQLAELENTNKVIVNGWDVTDYECWYDRDYCLEAVKKNGLALQFVREQTPEICMEAVKQDIGALQYVDKKVFINQDLENGIK